MVFFRVCLRVGHPSSLQIRQRHVVFPHVWLAGIKIRWPHVAPPFIASSFAFLRGISCFRCVRIKKCQKDPPFPPWRHKKIPFTWHSFTTLFYFFSQPGKEGETQQLAFGSYRPGWLLPFPSSPSPRSRKTTFFFCTTASLGLRIDFVLVTFIFEKKSQKAYFETVF